MVQSSILLIELFLNRAENVEKSLSFLKFFINTLSAEVRAGKVSSVNFVSALGRLTISKQPFTVFNVGKPNEVHDFFE